MLQNDCILSTLPSSPFQVLPPLSAPQKQGLFFFNCYCYMSAICSFQLGLLVCMGFGCFRADHLLVVSQLGLIPREDDFSHSQPFFSYLYFFFYGCHPVRFLLTVLAYLKKSNKVFYKVVSLLS